MPSRATVSFHINLKNRLRVKYNFYLFDFLPDAENTVICDIGCGNGRYGLYMASLDRAKTVVGFDFSAQAHAAQLAAEKVRKHEKYLCKRSEVIFFTASAFFCYDLGETTHVYLFSGYTPLSIWTCFLAIVSPSVKVLMITVTHKGDLAEMNLFEKDEVRNDTNPTGDVHTISQGIHGSNMSYFGVVLPLTEKRKESILRTMRSSDFQTMHPCFAEMLKRYEAKIAGHNRGISSIDLGIMWSMTDKLSTIRDFSVPNPVKQSQSSPEELFFLRGSEAWQANQIHLWLTMHEKREKKEISYFSNMTFKYVIGSKVFAPIRGNGVDFSSEKFSGTVTYVSSDEKYVDVPFEENKGAGEEKNIPTTLVDVLTSSSKGKKTSPGGYQLEIKKLKLRIVELESEVKKKGSLCAKCLSCN